MRTSAEWLDRARERAQLPSDYAVAKALGVPRQIASQWRRGTLGMTEEQAEALARLAGAPAGQVYAEVKASRAKRTSARAFWERVARALAAVVVVAVGVPGVAPVEAQGRAGSASQAMYYAQRPSTRRGARSSVLARWLTVALALARAARAAHRGALPC